MKVAGSSWSHFGLKSLLFFQLILSLSVSVTSESSCPSYKESEEWTHSHNLIDELAITSQTSGNVLNFMSDLTKNYDATPFWYNLIQAIALASGIRTTSEAVVHDLATTSFHGENLNSSLKEVLVAMKCSKNSVNTIDLSAVPHDEALGKKPYFKEGAAAPGNYASAVAWSPAKTLRLAAAMEQEVQSNSLADDSPFEEQDRYRRELRDGQRNSVLPDMHQPFFMSEAVPSSLVTRHPSIISVSGCPSGHIQDLRGMCRRIFQYTVNYGPNSSGSRGTSPGVHRAIAPSSNPWLARRPPVRRRPGSISDLVRESAFFKHSIRRGYVPPFSLSNFQNNGNSGSEGPQPIMDISLNDARAFEDPRPPVEVERPTPRIVMMGSTIPEPTSLITLSQSESFIHDLKGVKSTPDNSKKFKGSGSSEFFESSSAALREKEKKIKELKKEIKNAVSKAASTAHSSQDDDD
ncbi:hypothetical protein FHG87_011707 [Trinorchestia longiramus]|nr:hypothetical protein FHG87_011707 [Trinorchestia longiramus]